MQHHVRVIFTLVLGLVSVNLAASREDRYQELYLVEPEIAAILDQHVDELYAKVKKIHPKTVRINRLGVWKFDWLPGYYVKYGLDRIAGMEKVKKCIEEFNLNLLTVPDKKIYHLKGRPFDMSNLNYVVIIPEVKRAQNRPPHHKEYVRQLCTLMYESGYIDLTNANYITMDDGRVCIIDTESYFDRSQFLKGLLRMLGHNTNWNTFYTEDGLKYLLGEIKKQVTRKPHLAENAVHTIRKRLREQKSPYVWDYADYIMNYFKEDGIS